MQGTLGNRRLTRAVMAHLMATGAIAVDDDLIGPVAGSLVLSKPIFPKQCCLALSLRVFELVFNSDGRIVRKTTGFEFWAGVSSGLSVDLGPFVQRPGATIEPRLFGF